MKKLITLLLMFLIIGCNSQEKEKKSIENEKEDSLIVKPKVK